MSIVPEDFARMIEVREDEAGETWVAGLPALVGELCERWSLRVAGSTRFGYVGIVVPVRRRDGTPAALKVSFPDQESLGEAPALAAWDGDGAVRVLERDDCRFALLLEWLDADRSLFTLPVDDGVAVIARLLARLHRTEAPAGLPRLADECRRWEQTIPPRWERYCRDQDPRLRDAALETLARLGPRSGGTLLHRDLHYGNVLAGGREPWLAIDPKGLAGDPEYDVVPTIWNRPDELMLAADPHAAVRRRVDLVCDVAGLDRERAYRWTLVRCVEDLLWRMDNDPDPAAPHLLIAEALLPRHD